MNMRVFVSMKSQKTRISHNEHDIMCARASHQTLVKMPLYRMCKCETIALNVCELLACSNIFLLYYQYHCHYYDNELNEKNAEDRTKNKGTSDKIYMKHRPV